jgi:hypothetical protein
MAKKKSKKKGSTLIARTLEASLDRKKARLEELVAAIEVKKAVILEAFYDVGTYFKEIRDENLWAAEGAQSFDDFLARHRYGRTKVFEMISTVENVGSREAILLGKARSSELAKHMTLLAAENPKQRVRAMVKGNEAINGKPLLQSSARDLRRANAGMRPTTAPRGAAAAIKTVRGALEEIGLGRAPMQIHAASKGWLELRIRIRQSQLDAITE